MNFLLLFISLFTDVGLARDDWKTEKSARNLNFLQYLLLDIVPARLRCLLSFVNFLLSSVSLSVPFWPL